MYFKLTFYSGGQYDLILAQIQRCFVSESPQELGADMSRVTSKEFCLLYGRAARSVGYGHRFEGRHRLHGALLNVENSCVGRSTVAGRSQ